MGLLDRPTRRTLALGILGQSTERGAVANTDKAAYPQAFRSLRVPSLRVPINPSVGREGNWLFKVHDDLYDAGWHPIVVNGAVSGVSFVTQCAGIINAWAANAPFYRRRVPANTGDRGYAGDLISVSGKVWRCIDGDDLFAINTGPTRNGEYAAQFGTIYSDEIATLGGRRDATGLWTSRTSASLPAFPASPYIGQTLTETPANASYNPVKWRYEGDVGSNGYVASPTVCTETQQGIGFDPLGLLQRLHEEMQRVQADRKIIYIANGQADLIWPATTYKNAVKAIAAFFLRRGYEVMIGFTSYSPAITAGGSPATPTQWGNLVTGRTSAVTELQSEGTDGSGLDANRVHSGADLYTLMGTTGPMASGGAFMRSDNIHLNGRGCVGPASSGVDPAGKHVADAIKAVL